MMMALWRTPLPAPGRGPGRPRHSSIGASSAAGVVGGGAGVLLAVGGECVALRIGFCPLPHFLLIFCVLWRRCSRRWGTRRKGDGRAPLARQDAPPDKLGGARRLNGERTGGLATILVPDLVSVVFSPLHLDRASAAPRQRCSHAADASADFEWPQQYASSSASRFSSPG